MDRRRGQCECDREPPHQIVRARALVDDASEPDAEERADLVREEKDYFVIAANTKLQGSELLTTRAFNVSSAIAGFIEARAGRIGYPYVRRKN